MENSGSPCQYFQINVLESDFTKCKNCGHQKSEHAMYKSPSIIAARSSILEKAILSFQKEGQEEESKNDSNKDLESNNEQPKEQASGVQRTSIGSVGDIAQMFGGQSRNSLSRRKSDITYKVND